jgi:transposase
VQALNQLKAAIVSLEPSLRARLAQLKPAELAGQALLRERPALAPLRRLSERIGVLERELAELDGELDELTRRLCPQLRAEQGVGPVCSAQVLVSAGARGRLRSEASFAALAGVSPVEASSGQVKRHRLNRGGDRQLNWALHMSARSRISSHAETRAYYERLLTSGKSKREATRIVKRVLARRLYRALVAA